MSKVLKYLKPVVCFMAIFTVSATHAATVFNVGLAEGGDNLEPTVLNGTVAAGRGLTAEIGMEVGAPEDAVAFQLLLGTKLDFYEGRRLNGSTATAELTSYPVHALVLLNSGRMSFGGGLAYYLNPSYTPFNGSTVNFDNAPGFAVQGRFNFGGSNRPHVGLRYTKVTFKGGDSSNFNSSVANEVDASSVTLIFGFSI